MEAGYSVQVGPSWRKPTGREASTRGGAQQCTAHLLLRQDQAARCPCVTCRQLRFACAAAALPPRAVLPLLHPPTALRPSWHPSPAPFRAVGCVWHGGRPAAKGEPRHPQPGHEAVPHRLRRRDGCGRVGASACAGSRGGGGRGHVCSGSGTALSHAPAPAHLPRPPSAVSATQTNVCHPFCYPLLAPVVDTMKAPKTGPEKGSLPGVLAVKRVRWYLCRRAQRSSAPSLGGGGRGGHSCRQPRLSVLLKKR